MASLGRNDISSVEHSAFIDYVDELDMLQGVDLAGLMREITDDANNAIVYVMSHVIARSNSELYEFPTFMNNSLGFMVNTSAQRGVTYTTENIHELRRQLVRLTVDFIREVSNTAGWYNHRIVYNNALYGGNLGSVLAVQYRQGDALALSSTTQMLDAEVSSQVITGVTLLLGRS